MVGGSGQWMSTVVKSTAWAPLSDDRSIGIPKRAIQWDMRRLGTGGAGDVIAWNGFWPTGDRIHYCE